MSTITFDTLKFVERLEKAGVPREQASALAEAQKEAFAEALDSQLATKSDIIAVRADMREMELRMTIKLGTMMAAAIAITAALVKLL